MIRLGKWGSEGFIYLCEDKGHYSRSVWIQNPSLTAQYYKVITELNQWDLVVAVNFSHYREQNQFQSQCEAVIRDVPSTPSSTFPIPVTLWSHFSQFATCSMQTNTDSRLACWVEVSLNCYNMLLLPDL